MERFWTHLSWFWLHTRPRGVSSLKHILRVESLLDEWPALSNKISTRGKAESCTTTPFLVSASTQLILKISDCVSCFIFFVKFPEETITKVFGCLMMLWFCGSVILRWVSELTYCLADEIIIVEVCFGVRVNWGIGELTEVRGYSICDRQGWVFLPWCQVRGWHCSCLFRCN